MGRENPYRRFAVYSSIIFLLPSTLLGGCLAGYLADKFFGTRPWLMIVGIFLGVIGAFLQLFQLLMREPKRERNSSKQAKGNEE